jgi:hypothetical protein
LRSFTNLDARVHPAPALAPALACPSCAVLAYVICTSFLYFLCALHSYVPSLKFIRALFSLPSPLCTPFFLCGMTLVLKCTLLSPGCAPVHAGEVLEQAAGSRGESLRLSGIFWLCAVRHWLFTVLHATRATGAAQALGGASGPLPGTRGLSCLYVSSLLFIASLAVRAWSARLAHALLIAGNLCLRRCV